jgi:hypothetical protein
MSRPKVLQDDAAAQLGVERRRATKHVNVHLGFLWVCVRTEVALGQYQNTSRAYRFKLVK